MAFGEFLIKNLVIFKNWKFGVIFFSICFC
jgi:hypothetical protein